jgi:hypothetical protein
MDRVDASRSAISYNPDPSQHPDSKNHNRRVVAKLLMHKQKNANYRKDLLAM